MEDIRREYHWLWNNGSMSTRTLNGDPWRRRLPRCATPALNRPWPPPGLATQSVKALPRAFLHAWLVDRGSLTARLKIRCPQFRVILLTQRLEPAQPDECRLLGLRPAQKAWVREVLLCNGSTPLVFAHSVLPRNNVRGAWNLFAGLGSGPLGDALFSNPAIARGPLSFKTINPHHSLFHRVARHTPKRILQARRSLFVTRHKALLVTEIFL